VEDVHRMPSVVPAVVGRPRIVAEDLEAIGDRASQALERLSGATVLVAGAAGFLPSYIVDSLARSNEIRPGGACRVLCVDNFTTGVLTRLHHLQGRDDVALLTADLASGLTIDEPVDYIVHGASIASPTWYRRFPEETIDVNVLGTRHLLELARHHSVSGMLYLSSSEIYGNPPPDRLPTSEDYWGNVSCTGPRACYDESKRLAETLCTTYHRTFGVPVSMARPFNVYGPGLRLDDGRVVPDFLRNALREEPITIFSDGRVTRSFCYVADAVVAMLLLLTGGKAGEAYNVGNDEEITILDLAHRIRDRVGSTSEIVFVPYSVAYEENFEDMPRRVPRYDKIRDCVGWTPRIALDPLLDSVIDYHRSQVSVPLIAMQTAS
jgi:UDP-glucuronate decarboxylase